MTTGINSVKTNWIPGQARNDKTVKLVGLSVTTQPLK